MDLKHKGFTLVELLVVMTIIALLSAVILTGMNSHRARARDGKRISDMAQLQLVFESYYDACNQYPSITSPQPTTLSTATNNGCTSGTNLGSFISVLPVDPINSGSNVYVYTPTPSSCGAGTKCTGYTLQATLEQTNKVLNNDADTSNTGQLKYDVKP
jgi:prepilin-type N-terminal cleavage/methylation domain-containing protein